MAQHDYVIDNQASASARADMNLLFQAIASQNSGATAPATAYANQVWYDTSTDLLKIRNEANSGWITIGTVDQTNNVFNPNFLPATQVEAEAGTDNTKGMTPLRVKQSVAVLSSYPYKNATLFTSSGSWTVPAGITKAFVLVVGGGGGGAGASTSVVNGNGGVGGAGYATLTGLSGTITVTVGAGAAGSNTTSSSAGGSSTFSTVTATGGGGGTTNGANGNNGTATGADFTTIGFGYLSNMFGYAIPNSTCFSMMKDTNSYRPNSLSSTAALAYTAGNVGGLSAGAAGLGETGNTSNATGGVGGAVLIFY